jgi:O-antigen/teichoic acid export membrane protein
VTDKDETDPHRDDVTSALPPAGADGGLESSGSGPAAGSADDALVSSKTVLDSIVSLGTSEILARAIGFFITTYLARTLGPESFGVVAFAIAFTGFMRMVINAGLAGLGAREVARRPHVASDIAASVTVIRLAFACALIAIISGVAVLLDKPASDKAVIILFSLVGVPVALHTGWVYRGLERNRPASLATVTEQIVCLVLTWLVVGGPGDIQRVPLVQLVGAFVAATMLAVPLFRGRAIVLNLREGFAILRGVGYFTSIRLMRVVVGSFDVLLLGFVAGARDVGLYSAAYRLCYLLNAISTAIEMSYMPVATRAEARGSAHATAVGDRSLELVSAIAMPLVVGGVVLASPLMLMAFGPEYAGGVPALRLLLVSAGLVFLCAPTQNLLLSYDRLRTGLVIAAVAAGSNVVLNLLLTPRYGIAAAATITVFSEGVTLLLGGIAAYLLGVRLRYAALLRPALAAAVMAAALYAVGHEYGLALSLFVGASVYAVVLAALGGIPSDVKPILSGWWERARL